MNAVIRGAVAGAVGTIALDVTTYTDMALRGRASSGVPAETVKRMAQRSGVTIENANRATALGALSGYSVGVGIGALYGVARAVVDELPLLCAAGALATAAMLASDVPATTVGATNPKSWKLSGWLADIVPHAVYGLVAAAVFDRI